MKIVAINRIALLLSGLCAVHFVSLPQVSVADRIVLKNGRSLEGIIKDETAQRVVLDLGVGSARLEKDGIADIERWSEERNQQIHEEWWKQNYLSRKYVPRGMEDLADRFKAVVSTRNEAAKAKSLLPGYRARVEKFRRRLDKLKEELVEVSKKIVDSDPRTDIDEYNSLVTRSNATKGEIASVGHELDKVRKKMTAAAERITSHVSGLIKFRDYLERKTRYWQEKEKNRRHRFFLSRVNNLTASYLDEFIESQVETTTVGNSTMVKAVVNGRATGKLLVDTGSSTVLLTRRFARRAGVEMKHAKEVEIVLADGRKAKADQVRIGSLQIGDARVEDVSAVVLDSGAGQDIDGLLGMTFLKYFVVQFDGSSGNLQLTGFEP
jgi:clan AA aspartic protease (TIGR02281 family)